MNEKTYFNPDQYSRNADYPSEFRLPNGNRIVIEGDKMKLYKPGGREFTCVMPKLPVSKPTLSEPS